ncbi:hypothetical protein BG004_001189 [Podila humilis]|nr:hypothetical protein BG004_001189 [Podila humilis]
MCLRVAMLEIENQTQQSRKLAHANQELEESRLFAIGDQARTAKRLLLMSSQLEYTEQKLYNLTKQLDDGQKDSDLLRIERIKREALQEREDADRLRIETLQDELQEVQRSEKALQQKLTTSQTKYEALNKRHDVLRQKQQELEMARESKEAVAWLKETTNRLCSPPQGSLGLAIKQQERSSFQEGSTLPINIHQHSPSTSSPPYLTSIMDPPLAAQNQLISLIKELATTNSTLRTELTEYRDLLQDARNEVLALRSQVEDYELGNAFHDCCGQNMATGAGAGAGGGGGVAGTGSLDGFRLNRASWSAASLVGLEKSAAAIGASVLGHDNTLPGSPPPYMTTAAAAVATAEQHHHHHIHLPGVRGNVFGELERLYSQNQQFSASATAAALKHKSRHHGHGHGHHHHHHQSHHTSSSSKKDPATSKKRNSKDHERRRSPHSGSATVSVSTSTSTSETRRMVTTLTSPTTGGQHGHHNHHQHSGLMSRRQPLPPPLLDHGSSKLLAEGVLLHDPSAGDGGNIKGSLHTRSNRGIKKKSRSKKSLYTDVDMDMLGSDDEINHRGQGQGSQRNNTNGDDDDDEEDDEGNDDEEEDPGEQFSDSSESNGEQEPGFVAAFAEALSFLSFFSGPQLSGSP